MNGFQLKKEMIRNEPSSIIRLLLPSEAKLGWPIAFTWYFQYSFCGKNSFELNSSGKRNIANFDQKILLLLYSLPLELLGI